MTGRDEELREWTTEWQSGEEAPSPRTREAILRRVKRRTLGLRILVVTEAAVVFSALAFLAWLARTSPHGVDAAVAAGLTVLALAAFGFSLWNRRGVWRTVAETTAELVRFSLARARRRRRGLRAAWVLLAAEIVLLAPWVWLHLGAATGGPPAAAALARGYGLLALFTGGAAAVLISLGRWTEREITRLEALRRELGPGEVPGRTEGEETCEPAAR